MDFPLGYILAMNPEEISTKWPNLKIGDNFSYTSLKRRGFNCVAYALEFENKDWDMLVFAKIYNLDKTQLDHSANGYAKIFSEKFGFEKCDNPNLEEGFKKIALYENNEGDFTHIARQMESGKWTSKMGNYEDIEHYDLIGISGNFYGKPSMYMRKVI